MISDITLKIQEILETAFQSPENQHFFWVDSKYNPANNKLEIFLDSDKGLTLSDCSKWNRFLQEILDENQWLGEVYTLDISSPGATTPLLTPRQFAKNLGRELKINFIDKTNPKLTATLEKVEQDKIMLSYIHKFKEGKKNKKETVVKEVKYDEIEKAVVKLKF